MTEWTGLDLSAQLYLAKSNRNRPTPRRKHALLEEMAGAV